MTSSKGMPQLEDEYLTPQIITGYVNASETYIQMDNYINILPPIAAASYRRNTWPGNRGSYSALRTALSSISLDNSINNLPSKHTDLIQNKTFYEKPISKCHENFPLRKRPLELGKKMKTKGEEQKLNSSLPVSSINQISRTAPDIYERVVDIGMNNQPELVEPTLETGIHISDVSNSIQAELSETTAVVTRTTNYKQLKQIITLIGVCIGAILTVVGLCLMVWYFTGKTSDYVIAVSSNDTDVSSNDTVLSSSDTDVSSNYTVLSSNVTDVMTTGDNDIKSGT